MVTIDRSKGSWPAPEMLSWQRNMRSLRKTSSDLFEGMDALGGFYLPADMLPYGSHIFTEKHFPFAASKKKAVLSTYNNVKYPTACTWDHGVFSPEMSHWSGEIDWGVQGCISGSAFCANTFSKARNYESRVQVLCRYSSSCLVSRKPFEGVQDELPLCRSASLARENSLTHSRQRPKTSRQSLDRTNSGRKDRPTSAIPFAPAQKAKSRLADKVSQFSTRSEKDFYKDRFDGEMPVGPVVTSASTSPLAVKGCAREDFKSVHSPEMNERWAGPAFANSPPPSSLPVPSFTRRQSRASSLEVPRAADSICEPGSAAKCRGTSITP